MMFGATVALFTCAGYGLYLIGWLSLDQLAAWYGCVAVITLARISDILDERP